MKRFQECNKLTKIWRYRFYIPIPFKYIWYRFFSNLMITSDNTGLEEKLESKELWSILIGIAQYKMNWYYTMEETMSQFDDLDEDDDNDDIGWKGFD